MPASYYLRQRRLSSKQPRRHRTNVGRAFVAAVAWSPSIPACRSGARAAFVAGTVSRSGTANLKSPSKQCFGHWCLCVCVDHEFYYRDDDGQIRLPFRSRSSRTMSDGIVGLQLQRGVGGGLPSNSTASRSVLFTPGAAWSSRLQRSRRCPPSARQPRALLVLGFQQALELRSLRGADRRCQCRAGRGSAAECASAAPAGISPRQSYATATKNPTSSLLTVQQCGPARTKRRCRLSVA
jgi:hypothetical protein